MLDNLVWHALNGPHRHWSERHGALCWYPSAVAPFAAVASPDCHPDLCAAALQGFREPAFFVGVLPASLPVGWYFALRSMILQLQPAPGEPEPVDERDIRVLDVADRPAMLTLARVAFPDFYRSRTAELGEYLGIFEGNELVAMAGERLAVHGLQEISGVCTHPHFVGRGYARRLTGSLLRRHRARGVSSFLHVSEANVPARRLYQSMGFVARASLPMGKVARMGPWP